jgi:cell division protease FtsH
MEHNQRQFSIWYVLLGVMLLVAIQSVFAAHQETVPYSDFKALVARGAVREVVLDRQTIRGTVRTDTLASVLPKERAAALRQGADSLHAFATTRVEDPELVARLEAAGVRFAGRAENPWSSALFTWMLPALLLFGLWGVVMRRMSHQGGLMAIGKSKARVYVERSTGVTFGDVAGIDEARAELAEVVDFLKSPDRYRRLGGKIPKGVLLVGAPGTGKTLLARALAGEAKVPFFSLTGSDFVEMFVGVGAARVRDLFVQAQENAPSIIFIDELDALGRARSAASVVGGHEEREQTLNQLLAEMDGFDSQKGVLILAATNRPEILDPALLRPGRFDRKIVLDRPDLKGRQQILEVHARGVTLAPTMDLAAVAARTPGFVGADLANLVNEAALHAARTGRDAVTMADFEEAIDRVVAGLERKSRVINPQEKRIVAYHEAGHALVAELRPHADKVAKISIIPRGVAALGYTRQQPTDDRYLLTRTELLDRLDVLLGGRVAEEIVFGDISTGAQDDLQRATDLARDMVARYGMSETLGLATFEEPSRALFLDVPAFSRQAYGAETAQLIDGEIRTLLEAARARVLDTLSAHRGTLERVAGMLIEKEVVDREALTHALLPVPVHPAPEVPVAVGA